MSATARALKMVAALFDYPGSGYQDRLREALSLRDLPARARAALSRYQAAIAGLDDLTLAERYVAIFDFTPACALSLTYQEIGESRLRGQALIALSGVLHAEGFHPRAGELPDHLPLLLEFLAVRRRPDADPTLPRRVAAALHRIRAALLGSSEGASFVPLVEAAASLLPPADAVLPTAQPEVEADVPYPLLTAADPGGAGA
jgi:nitrate reductase delta subunit